MRGVSFEVARGEVFCLLGPNGAGKTTTVEILEGYRAADQRRGAVLGIDPATGARELREQVGIVLQQCGVQQDLTVAELVEMYGRYHVAPAARWTRSSSSSSSPRSATCAPRSCPAASAAGSTWRWRWSATPS